MTAKNMKALFEAAEAGDTASLEAGLTQQAKVDYQNGEGQTLLMVSVKSGNEDCVNLLLSRGADPDVQDENGATALHHAVEIRNANIVATLCAANANTELRDEDGDSPLSAAVVYFNVPEIQYWTIGMTSEGVVGPKEIEAPPEAVEKEAERKTRMLEVIESLLVAGANIESTDEDGDTVLGLACFFAVPEVVGLLLRHGSDPGAGNTRPLSLALQSECDDQATIAKVVSLILKTRITDHYTELERLELKLSVIRSGNLGALQAISDHGTLRESKAVHSELLEDSIEEDEVKQKTRLFQDCQEGREQITEICDLLIDGEKNTAQVRMDKLKDLNLAGQNGATLLSTSARLGQLDIVRHLVQCGADVDGESYAFADGKTPHSITPIGLAAQFGNLDVVEFLARNGADLERVTSLGNYTPLMFAIQADANEIVRLLLDIGASAETLATSGPIASEVQAGSSFPFWTPLTLAAARSNEKVCRMLLEHAAQVDLPNSEGWTAVKLATAHGELSIVNMLLLHGADPDITDSEGWTPLMNAANTGSKEIVSALLAHQPRIAAKNKDDQTAYDLALKNGHEEVAALLAFDGLGADELSNEATKADYDGLTFRNTIAYEIGADEPFSGIGRSLWKNGNPKKEATFRNGRLEGTRKWWYVDGGKELWISFKNGVVSGKHQAWHPNGKRWVTGNYVAGEKTGRWQWWYPNGQIRESTQYEENTLNGVHKRWYESGEMEEECTRTVDEIDGQAITWHASGMKAAQLTCFDGVLHGALTQWYDNGNRELVAFYMDGEKHGMERRWDPDGVFEYEQLWKHGKSANKRKKINPSRNSVHIHHWQCESKRKVARQVLFEAIQSAYELNSESLGKDTPDFTSTISALIKRCLSLEKGEEIEVPLSVDKKLILTVVFDRE